jgi:hypothetical protein
LQNYRVPTDSAVCTAFLAWSGHWAPPPHHPPGGGPPPPRPPWYRGVGHTRLRERGLGSPNSDEGTYTMELYI